MAQPTYNQETVDAKLNAKAAVSDLTALTARVTTTEGKIPAEATSTNQLADKAYVQEQLSGLSGQTYIVPTYAALGEVVGMVSNDAAIVQADETHDGGATFYKYSGSAWEYVFTINTSPLTDEQAAAINSGITSAKVTAYDLWLAAGLSQILTNSGDAGQKNITNLHEFDVRNVAGEITFAYSGGNDEFVMSSLAQGNLRQWANSFLKMNVMRPNPDTADYLYEMHAKPNFVVFVASSDGRAYLPDASTVDSDSWAAVFNGWNEREWTEAVYYQPVNGGGEAVWSPQFQLVQVNPGMFEWSGYTAGAGARIADRIQIELQENAQILVGEMTSENQFKQLNNKDGATLYVANNGYYLVEPPDVALATKVDIATQNLANTRSSEILNDPNEITLTNRNGTSNSVTQWVGTGVADIITETRTGENSILHHTLNDLVLVLSTARTLSNESLLTKADVDAILAPLGWS
jgi:hypothetical protein